MKTLLILLMASIISYAGNIKYEIYNASLNKLIAKGEKIYSLKDIVESPYERDGQKINEKMIELEQGYKVGARIFEEFKLTGFGLVAELKSSDFSWEWYEKEKDFLFKKLQGGTYIKVRVSGGPMLEILEEVYFIDDTELEFKSRCKENKYKYRIIIKKGSVLKFD